MSQLTEFLLDRIAEDLAVATRTAERMEHVPPAGIGGVGNLGIVGYPLARVLAECEAKREIVGLLSDAEQVRAPDMGWHFMKAAVRALALPYADHPDYEEAWRE